MHLIYIVFLHSRVGCDWQIQKGICHLVVSLESHRLRAFLGRLYTASRPPRRSSTLTELNCSSPVFDRGTRFVILWQNYLFLRGCYVCWSDYVIVATLVTVVGRWVYIKQVLTSWLRSHGDGRTERAKPRLVHLEALGGCYAKMRF